MKLLIGHCFYRSSSPSGEDSAYRNERKLLEGNGVDVVPFEKYNDALTDHGFIQKTKDGLNYIWSYKSYRETKEIIRRTNPDIAHFHNIFPQLSASVYKACHELGVPVIQTLHNYRNICPGGLLQRHGTPCELCLDHSLMQALKHRCYRDSIISTLPMAAMIYNNRINGNFTHYVDRFIALTQFAKSKFIKAGLPESSITVKPNFVHARGTPSFDSGNYALYIGRFSQEKGVNTLVQAWNELRHIPLKMAGDGPLLQPLRAFAQKNDMNIDFLGNVSNERVFQLLQNARFIIVPSECYEGLPVTLCEAFSCGKPAIASDIGGVGEVVDHGVTGLKFEAGNKSQLQANVNRLWQNRSLQHTLSKASFTTYEQNYSPNTNAQLLLGIYESVLSEKAPRLNNSFGL